MLKYRKGGSKMFIPLNNKSNYTLLSSLLKIDDLIDYAKEYNLSHISLADTNMFGTMEFIKKCEKNDIIPVVGLEIKGKDFSLVLFAKNYIGYQSLIKLSTIQNERVVEEKDLNTYAKECIAIVPFSSREKYEEFGKIYVEIYLGYSNKEEEKETRILTKNIVFFQENLYRKTSDEKYLSYLYRIRDGKTISEEMNYETENHTIKIAESCHIVFPPAENLLPIYDCKDPKKYLFDLCRAGLQKRLGKEIPEEYRERLTYELTVINDMGFSNYFLVVYDFIRFAKKNKILVGPGRGSAAGSLVAYSLGITDIDPLKYDLLFERFLNPERKTMPDIDTDFPDNKRDIVIDYVKEKYGEKRVGGIITFGTMAAKQAIRDVSRVMNIPLYKVDALCKFIPAMS